jgi:uncharacterized protein (DUF3820 family)
MSNSFNTSQQVGDPSAFHLPYGRYVGQQLSDVPAQYLRYMYANHNFTLNPELQRAIEAYLQLPPDPNIRPGSPAAQTYAQTAANPPSGRPAGPRGGSNGGYRSLPETGLDGFRKAFERAKREVLLGFQDDPEIAELLEETLGRVRRSLGI